MYLALCAAGAQPTPATAQDGSGPTPHAAVVTPGVEPSDGLDEGLRARAGRAGTSRVIIQSRNERDIAWTLARIKGHHLRDLRGAHVADVPNSKLRYLARHAKLSEDRVASGSLFRVTGTIGSDFVNKTMHYTGVGVGVAVIDSGITLFHDDLDRKGKSASVFVDFVNQKKTAYDDWGHGTHISGIISGDGFDSDGRHTGIAPASRLLALKALDGDGNGYVSDIIAAIQWTIDNRKLYNARVINISANAQVLESYTTDPLCLAVREAVEAGIVVVASAGNLGTHPVTGRKVWGGIGAPGNCPWALTVGASSDEGDQDPANDIIPPFTSRGPTRFDILAKPDIAAPGTGVVSATDAKSRLYLEKPSWLIDGTVRSSVTAAKPYMVLTGSSMSAAVVSGTVALMLQANPSLTPNLVKGILQYTASFNPNYDELEQGAGFISARGAAMLAEYFRTGNAGDPYPFEASWSRHVIWGNLLISGGVLAPNANAWSRNVQWGASGTPTDYDIVWGDNCQSTTCEGATWGTSSIWQRSSEDLVKGTAADNVVWGNYWDDNIVWGNHYDDNIVWGNQDDDNIVWGNRDDDNIVWGNRDDDNIVWGNRDDDNIVWGNYSDDNIVWGNDSDDNIVWGNRFGENIVWGNYRDDNIVWGNRDDDNIVWGNYEDDNIVWGNTFFDNFMWGN